MDSFSRDDRDKHLITRGNVDGIVSAALFLSVFPSAKVTFVTSPAAGARVVARDHSSSAIYLSDLALVPELEARICEANERSEVVAFDHHQQHDSPVRKMMILREGMSAASIMYHYFHIGSRYKGLVAIADMVEFCDTPLLREMSALYGLSKIEEEARTLDFSWRLDIDDDSYRMQAALHLSRGSWPSEVSCVRRRYLQVLNEQRWPKALARVKSNMRIRGSAAILHSRDKNRSLYGFGTRALVEVAKEKGCAYAVMINERRQHSSVSMRGLQPGGVNLGRFVEDFTLEHGLEGGGHPTSAGARIPVQVTGLFLDRFMAISAR
ncbi:MAG: DHH family phosphoesterase [Methanomassiliicoccales archaeon]